MAAKTKRLKINEATKLKLWAMSGGRCEFPGCNKPVWEEGLTLKTDNFGQMAHNIPSSKNGPRGEEDVPREGVDSFENLLLVCGEHHKLFDGANRSDYSIATLREHKRKHEDRIEIQTSIQLDMKSAVLRLHAGIGNSTASISYSEAANAMVPNYYPFDRYGLDLDLKGVSQTNRKSYWQTVATEIKTKTKEYLRSSKPDHVSLFGLAPIPALVLFGRFVGNIIPNVVYQKQRTSDGWNWPTGKFNPGFRYEVKKPVRFGDTKDIAVVVSLSGTINTEEVKAVQKWKGVYEIKIASPSPYFIDHPMKLEQFRKVYRALLSDIVSKHGQEIVISLFLAVPNSIAIACGQEILPKADPAIWVYEYVSADKKFIKALKIN